MKQEESKILYRLYIEVEPGLFKHFSAFDCVTDTCFPSDEFLDKCTALKSDGVDYMMRVSCAEDGDIK